VIPSNQRQHLAEAMDEAPERTDVDVSEDEGAAEAEVLEVEPQFVEAPDDSNGSPRSTTPVYEALRPELVEKHGLAVILPPAQRRWEYQVYEEPTVDEILEAYEDDEDPYYLVRFTDGREVDVCRSSNLPDLTSM